MRVTTRERRLFWSLGLVAVAISAMVMLPRFVLSSEGARAELINRIGALTGAPVEISGNLDYSILPRTRLIANQIVIGSGVDLAIDQVIADFDPIDALFGRAKIARLVLVRPDHRPRSSAVAQGGSLPSGEEGAASASLEDAPAASPTAATMLHNMEELARRSIERIDHLQILVIRNGIWRSQAETFGPNGISNANITITRTSSRSAFRMAGSFTWNGQPTSVDLRVDSTTALQAGGESDVSMQLASPALDLDFDGSMTFGALPRLEGRFEGRGESFARTARWLSGAEFSIPDVGGVGLAGDLRLSGGTLAVTNAELDVAGSAGVGALEYNLDRDRVDGTLAFATLDLTSIAEAIVPLPSGAFGMGRPINADFARSAELALRLSAEQATFGSLTFSQVAAVFSVEDGGVALELGDAGLYGGRAYGRLALADKGKTTISGELSGSGVDLSQLSNAFGGPVFGLSGVGQFQAELSTPADDWRTILTKAKSDLGLTATGGVLSGFDPAVFANPGEKPIYSGITGGAVPFERLEAEIRMAGPRVTFDVVSIRNAGFRLDIDGQADLKTGRMSFEGLSETLPQTASTAEVPSSGFMRSKPIPFTVTGTWPDPRVITRAPVRSEPRREGSAPSDL